MGHDPRYVDTPTPDAEDLEKRQWSNACKQARSLLGLRGINTHSGTVGGYIWDRDLKRVAYVYEVNHRGPAFICLEGGLVRMNDNFTIYSTRANAWRHHLRRIREWVYD